MYFWYKAPIELPNIHSFGKFAAPKSDFTEAYTAPIALIGFFHSLIQKR